MAGPTLYIRALSLSFTKTLGAPWQVLKILTLPNTLWASSSSSSETVLRGLHCCCWPTDAYLERGAVAAVAAGGAGGKSTWQKQNLCCSKLHKQAKQSKAPARMIYITLLYKNWQRSHQISTEQELWATPENSSLNSIVCQMPQLFSLLLFSSWGGEGEGL